MSEPLSLFILYPLAQFGELLTPTWQTSRLAFAGGRFQLVPGLLPESMELTAAEDGRILVMVRPNLRVAISRGYFDGASSLSISSEALIEAGNVIDLVAQGTRHGKAIAVQGLVGEERRAEFWIRATHDPLTAAHNRVWMRFRWPELVLEASASNRPIALVYADLDRLMMLNDRYGHRAGDTVLAQASAALTDALAGEDGADVVRFGGEEFVVLLPGRNLEDARRAAEKLRVRIESEPILHRDEQGETPLRVSMSFGVACSATEPAGLDLDVLLRAAEERMWDAKRGGRNRVAG